MFDGYGTEEIIRFLQSKGWDSSGVFSWFYLQRDGSLLHSQAAPGSCLEGLRHEDLFKLDLEEILEEDSEFRFCNSCVRLAHLHWDNRQMHPVMFRGLLNIAEQAFKSEPLPLHTFPEFIKEKEAIKELESSVDSLRRSGLFDSLDEPFVSLVKQRKTRMLDRLKTPVFTQALLHAAAEKLTSNANPFSDLGSKGASITSTFDDLHEKQRKETLSALLNTNVTVVGEYQTNRFGMELGQLGDLMMMRWDTGKPFLALPYVIHHLYLHCVRLNSYQKEQFLFLEEHPTPEVLETYSVFKTDSKDTDMTPQEIYQAALHV